MEENRHRKRKRKYEEILQNERTRKILLTAMSASPDDQHTEDAIIEKIMVKRDILEVNSGKAGALYVNADPAKECLVTADILHETIHSETEQNDGNTEALYINADITDGTTGDPAQEYLVTADILDETIHSETEQNDGNTEALYINADITDGTTGDPAQEYLVTADILDETIHSETEQNDGNTEALYINADITDGTTGDPAQEYLVTADILDETIHSETEQNDGNTEALYINADITDGTTGDPAQEYLVTADILDETIHSETEQNDGNTEALYINADITDSTTGDPAQEYLVTADIQEEKSHTETEQVEVVYIVPNVEISNLTLENSEPVCTAEDSIHTMPADDEIEAIREYVNAYPDNEIVISASVDSNSIEDGDSNLLDAPDSGNDSPYQSPPMTPQEIENASSSDSSQPEQENISQADNNDNVNTPAIATETAIEPTERFGRKKKIRQSLKGRARHIRKERTEKRNIGQKYVTEKGKVIRERQCKPLEPCRLKCKERFSDNDRIEIFKEYWGTGNHSKRMNYIASLVTTEPKKTHRLTSTTDTRKNRNLTHKYSLRIKGTLHSTYKKCFLATFDETNKFLDNIMKKMKNNVSGILTDDQRGKHAPPNKIGDNDIVKVKLHLLSIPSYESHYSRRDTEKRYLPSHYTIRKCYEEYKKTLDRTSKPVSLTVYNKVFHQLNLAIKRPSKDTCNTCDNLQMKISVASAEERETLEEKLKLHHAAADQAYATKRDDKALSLEDRSIMTIAFDLQQCLPTPHLETSVVFYKRQLWVFNLTVHVCVDNQAYCYMWSEVEAGRGANQIASCIRKHLHNVPPHVKHVILWSDSCGGQNKNSYMTAMFLSVMKTHPTLEIIDHKFLVPGHTHMECDSDHALIEKMKKKSGIKIYHPHDWMQLVRQTGKKKPFHVIAMKQADFFQYSGLFKKPLQNKKLNDNKEEYKWHDFRWLRYTKETGKMQYKESLNAEDPFKVITYTRRGQARNPLEPELSYQGPVAIADKKKKDLLKLLPLIPDVFHEYYMNIPSDETIPDIIPDVHIPDPGENDDNECDQ